MRPLLILIPSLLFAQSYTQTPHTVQNKVGAAAELCLQYTDATLKCVDASTSGWVPKVTATIDLGLTGTRFRDGWFSRNLTVGSALTVAGATTLSGTTSMGGTLTFASDNTYNIGGTSTGRPANVNAVSSINLYHTTSSSVLRTAITTASTVWYNSSGTLKASVNTTSGAIWGEGGLYVGSGVAQVVDSSAQWVSHLVPSADNAADIGASAGNHWRDGYLDGDLFADELGSSSARITKLWVTNIDCSGTCPGGGSSLPAVDTTSIAEGSSDATKEVRFEVDGLTTATVRVMTVPDVDQILAGRDIDNSFTAAQNSTVGFKSANAGGTGYVAGNKIEIHQQNTGNHFDIKTTGTNAFNIVTPSNTLVQAWDFSTGTPSSTLAADFLPSGAMDLGSSSFPWTESWVTQTVTQNLWPIASGYIGLQGNLLPGANVTYNLGDGSHAFANVFSNVYYANAISTFSTDIVWYGNMLMGADNTYTLGGASTRASAVYAFDGVFADDVTVGDALTVTGAATHSSTTSLAGNVTFASDNAYNIGTTSGGRPANIGAVSSIILYNTTSSSTARIYMDTAGQTWNNSSGTQKASVNNTSGAMWATGGFYAGSGVIQVVDSNARWVGADLFFPSDNTYNIGNAGSGSRPANISAASTINLYNNSTSTLRTQITTSSTTWKNASGTNTASVNTTSGAIWGTSFFVGAGVTAGSSVTFTVRDAGGGGDCTIVVTSGIVTGGSC